MRRRRPRWSGGRPLARRSRAQIQTCLTSLLRHEEGGLSSVVSSQAIQRYRRPGLELYGTEGTANLLGDDWDPRGFEIWRNEDGRWEEYEAIDPTWLWADGLREAVLAVREDRPPLADPAHDLHVLEIVDAARQAAAEGRAVPVASRFGPLDLRPEEVGRPERPPAPARPHAAARRAVGSTTG